MSDSVLSAKPDELPMVTIERVPYVTQREHEGRPAGTKCFAQRMPSDYDIVLEFEDGTTIKLHETHHLAGYERGGTDIFDIEDRRCMAQIEWAIKNQA